MKAHLPAIVHGAFAFVGSIGSWFDGLSDTQKAITVLTPIVSLIFTAGWVAHDFRGVPAELKSTADTVRRHGQAITALRRGQDSTFRHLGDLEFWRRSHTDSVTRPTMARLEKIEENAQDQADALHSIQASQYLYAKRQDSILARTGRIDAMLRRLLCRADNRSANRCELQELGSGGGSIHANARSGSR